MGEESYPEDRNFDGDLGGALELMERRLGDLVPRGPQPREKRIVVIEGTARPETLREKLERQREELVAAISVLSGQLAKRTAQVAELDRYPTEDPFKDGDSLEFKKWYPGSDQSYTFMALRADGLWYTTGSRGPQGVEWARLTEWMGLGVTDVYKIGASRKTPVRW
jgi:hypothetical protein